MTDRNRILAISVLAGESVLAGTDPEGDRAIIERLGQDPDFAAERAAWERRLAPLAHIVPPVQPSASLWSRIAAQTISEADQGATIPFVEAPLSGDGVVVGLEEAIAVRTRHLEARVARWRWACIATAALAAGIVAFAYVGPRMRATPTTDQRYVAVVNATGDLPPLIVSVDLASGELTLKPVDLKQEAGKSLELWAVAPGARPVSLGLIAKPERRSIEALTPATWKDPGLLLAVSVEPEGGSPTGQPTGDVVYKGKLVSSGQ